MAALSTTGSNTTIVGTDQADTITDAFVNNAINGGGGDDTITATAPSETNLPGLIKSDTIHGGAGDDIINTLGGVLFGDDGNDKISADGAGNIAFIDGGAGNDTIDGGLSLNTYVSYSTATGGVTVDLGASGPQDIGGGQGIDVLANVHGVIGTAFDDIITAGNGGHNFLIDGAGDDRVTGGAGSDEFAASPGNDTLIGNGGFDKLWFSPTDSDVLLLAPGRNVPPPTGGITVDLSITGPQDIGGGFGRDTIIGIDNVVGTAFADTIIGNDNANMLSGSAGSTGFVTDTIYGGGGNDFITVGWAGFVRGGAGDDFVLGGANFDDIQGNQGNDVEHGFGGNDWVVGGQDNDQLYGDDGADVVYGNLGADSCYGGDGDDWVRGGQGDDIVDGGAGNDLIWGDRGNDTVTGGAGADTFHTFVGAGVDKVTDFNGGEGDRIVIDDHVAYTITQVGSDTVITLVGSDDTLVLMGVSAGSFNAAWVTAA